MMNQAPVPVTAPARPALRMTWHIDAKRAGRSVLRARWSGAEVNRYSGVRDIGGLDGAKDLGEPPISATPKRQSAVGGAVIAAVASVRRTYSDVLAAWRAGAHLPPALPVRDYPIARR